MQRLLLAGILAGSALAQALTDPPPPIQLTSKPGIGGKSPRAYGEAKLP